MVREIFSIPFGKLIEVILCSFREGFSHQRDLTTKPSCIRILRELAGWGLLTVFAARRTS
jgi:hypothetical protein